MKLYYRAIPTFFTKKFGNSPQRLYLCILKVSTLRAREDL
ncbi:hypothetical protein SAMN05216383_10158 [Prevotella sp. KH2C16]|nr:hypothetical protein SAMN05216383_10158 [Prevotella sp. KH2C16]